MRTCKWGLVLSIVALACFLYGCAQTGSVAPSGQKTTIRIASPFKSDTIVVDAAEKFKELVEKGSGGRIDVQIDAGSTAEQAGLRAAHFAPDGTFVAGDIIVGVDGRAVTGVGELLGRLDDYKVGDTVRLQVRRDGGKVELPVTLQPGS